MSRLSRDLIRAGVLLGALGAAFWLVRGGRGVDLLVQLAQELLGMAVR